MKRTTRRRIAVWILGVVLGTAWIGLTSPLLVRTYAPLHADAVRGVWTLPPHTTYRWRSEGYASTRIGPLGMPGKSSIQPQVEGRIRVALWGDSQAEGVCVRDEEKIFTIAEQLSDGAIEVFPLARSGEDAADWLTQFSAVEKALHIDIHVLLIVDLPDLLTASQAPVAPPSEADVAQANAAIAATLPAFVIQAARNLLTAEDGLTRRKLRFSVGPVSSDGRENNVVDRSANHRQERQDRAIHDQDNVWLTQLAELRRGTLRPLVILYAPKTPQIVGNNVAIFASPDFPQVQRAAQSVGVPVIDLSSQLFRSAVAGRWPHGFHNGLIGRGHLNAIGNQIVAAGLIDAIKTEIEQGN